MVTVVDLEPGAQQSMTMLPVYDAVCRSLARSANAVVICCKPDNLLFDNQATM